MSTSFPIFDKIKYYCILPKSKHVVSKVSFDSIFRYLNNAGDVEVTVHIMPTVVLSDNIGLRLINFRPIIRDVCAFS